MTGWNGCSSPFALGGKKAAITRSLVLLPPQLENNFVVHVVGEARLRRRLRLAELVQLLRRHRRRRLRLRPRCSGLAIAGRSGLFWCWDAHPQRRSHLPTHVDHHWEHNDDPVRPSACVVAKSATQGAVIRFIKHQSSLVIGEPNDELLFFFPVIADQFHRHGFDPKLLLSFQILSPKVLDLSNSDARRTISPSFK